MIIFLTLTALLWFSLIVILYHLTRYYQITVSLREVFLLAALILGLIILFSTEGLSLFTALTPTAIKITWLIVFMISLGSVTYLYLRRRDVLQALFTEIRSRAQVLKTQYWQFYVILSLIALSLIATLITIKLNPVPTNGDSMRYHLTRTLVWEQQASVRHYATHNLHQIGLPPFAEYTLMQVNILVGNDSLSRIVQWIAMLVCLVAVSEIAKKIGANSRQQLISALLCVSNPMVIAQSTNTMNDLVVAAWLLCFVNFGLRFKRDPGDVFNTVVTGLFLGMSLISKSTAFIFALPISIWIALRVIRLKGIRLTVLKSGTVIVLMIFLTNAGHLTRNMVTFGQPFGDDAGGTVNELFSLRSLASNSIRNIQMHMPSAEEDNSEIIKLLGEGIKKITWNLHELTGLDPKDPRTTYRGNYVGFTSPGGFNTSEGRAGSFVHLVLIFFTIILSPFRLKKNEGKEYVVVLIVTFLLFSFLLKAQSPMNRLIMPYLLMWVPLIGVTLFRERRSAWFIFPLLVWVLCLPWLINANSRPLLPNQDRAGANWPSEGFAAYFLRNKELVSVFDEATTIISESQCSEVGLVFHGGNYLFEYPFWKMLYEKDFNGTINYMLVTNVTSKYQDPLFSPCIIFSNTELDHLSDYSLLSRVEGYWIYAEN